MVLPAWQMLASAASLAAVPLLWVLLHRGERRRRAQEGKTDGMLLLFALLCALGALWLGGVSLVRGQREARAREESVTVSVEVQRCRIARQRPAGRTGGWSHELSCDVMHRVRDGSAHEHEMVAGYPSSRTSLDRWREQHPPGTVIELRQSGSGDRERLSGFAEQVPSATTTARGAARQSLLFAVVGFLLFVASRLVVARKLAAR